MESSRDRTTLVEEKHGVKKSGDEIFRERIEWRTISKFRVV